mgnify:FL=1|tara:strand:- start:1617 stop:1814 length:198 start_codon:yes stop_codon:yes gene_type:complete
MRKPDNPAAGLALTQALHKLTQTELADTVGLSPSMLSHIVGGRKPIPDRLLAYLGFERVQRIERL